jgi:GntR family transcriptional regulator, transcriptional repressor for pyruvate dehydrogenase complex
MGARDLHFDERTNGLLPIRTAARLREDILRCQDGDYLGSEDELVAKYGVSHPTFRQTARMLELEQLLSVRRGPGGGYYARSPVVSLVARSVATYLRAQNVSPDQLFRSARTAGQAIARAAAGSTDAAGRQRLADVRAQVAGLDPNICSADDLMRVQEQVRVAMSALAHDPVNELLLAALDHVADEAVRAMLPRSDAAFRAKHLQLRLLLIDAILAREPDLAEMIFARSVDLALENLHPPAAHEDTAARDDR